MKEMYLQPEEIIVTEEPARITTVLGSCVAVCAFDRRLKVGGICHFVLPSREAAPSDDLASSQGNMGHLGSQVDIAESASLGRYADEAIPTLFRRLKQLGSQKEDLIVKIVGGGAPPGGAVEGEFSVGASNIEAAIRELRSFGFHAESQEVGGHFGRKIRFYSDSGAIEYKKMDYSSHLENAGPSEKKRVVSTPSEAHLQVRKVLIVDDAPVIQKILRKILESDPEIQIVGVANNPIEAEPLIQALKPDVITLDIFMPQMNGIEFLESIWPKYKIPVVMISSLGKNEGDMVLQALELGAVDYIQKPDLANIEAESSYLCEKIKMAARAKLQREQRTAKKKITAEWNGDHSEVLIAIGSSTGGTIALAEILRSLPTKIPPILIVQHIPYEFSLKFATRLNEMCPFEVRAAKDRDELVPNLVLIAPGGYQMRVERTGGKLIVRINNDPPVNRHKPSVDYLFDSVAEIRGKRIIGVLLTGMGADGARGLLKLRQRGARTVAQDEESSVVFGMPKAAIDLGAAERVAALGSIPQVLAHWSTK